MTLEILSNLNDEQKRAVCSEHQYNMILAGAGSGKTRVLVQRLSYLVQQKEVMPYNILMVTFTNKAARQMRDRAEVLLSDSVKGAWIGTFHSICLRILRSNTELAKLQKDFQVLSSDDKKRILRRIIIEEKMDPTRYKADSIAGFISKCKQIGQRADQVSDTMFYFKVAKKLYQKYERICELSNIIDFDEILLRCYELLKQYPDLLENYQSRFQHIMIDEFQDTSDIQYKWVCMLAGQNNNLMIVGDDDQSIYGWRGAKVDNMLNFGKNFPEVQTYRLEQNYRSTSNILAAANAVISTNEERLSKKLWTTSQEGNKIDIYKATDERDEANAIVQYITAYVQKNSELSLNDVAILYRINSLSRNLEEHLRRERVNYRVYGGLRFYDRVEIRNALAYLRVVANPHDDAALGRIINFPPRGMGKKTIEIITGLASEHNISLWQGITMVLQQNLVSKKVHTSLQELQELIALLQGMQQDIDIKTLVKTMYERTEMIGHYRESGKEIDQTRIENLQELLTSCQQFQPIIDDELESTVLQSYLETVALDMGDEEDEDDAPAVQLMTIHAAKGLEFPLVVLCGMDQGLFPSSRSIEEDNLHEETRLCYVAITRAEKQLFITHTQFRGLYGRSQNSRDSEFLQHIPDKVCNRIQVQTQYNKSAHSGVDTRNVHSYDSRNVQSYSLVIGSDLPQPGTRIRHPSYGEGVISSFEGSSEDLIVAIEFEEGFSNRSEVKKFLYKIVQQHMTII